MYKASATTKRRKNHSKLFNNSFVAKKILVPVAAIARNFSIESVA